MLCYHVIKHKSKYFLIFTSYDNILYFSDHMTIFCTIHIIWQYFYVIYNMLLYDYAKVMTSINRDNCFTVNQLHISSTINYIFIVSTYNINNANCHRVFRARRRCFLCANAGWWTWWSMGFIQTCLSKTIQFNRRRKCSVCYEIFILDRIMIFSVWFLVELFGKLILKKFVDII